MSSSNAIIRCTADTMQAAIAVASTVTVDRYDHAAAAAYLMRHHGATALAVLAGGGSSPPVGIITEADIIQAAADGKDLNKVRVHELMSQSGPCPVRPGAAGLRAGSPAGR